MNGCARYLISAVLALLLSVPPAFAQTESPAPDVPVFSQPELDQMLAPIALYPDALLSQILMAATYPLEIVQAARWSKANPGLVGEQAVRAIDDRDWDPSVKSLVAFPNVLALLDEKLEWTERLGDAFLAQPAQVMDTVQALRQRAQAAGNLASNDRYVVQQQERVIVITSPPEVIYVPYYDPYVVYGTWWWPSYRPIFWHPWPGYAVYHGYGGFRWGVAIFIGHGFFFGHCDWRYRYVRVVDVHPFYYHRVHRPIPVRHVWVHEPQHRRGVPYRHPDVRARYAQRVNTPQARPATTPAPVQTLPSRRPIPGNTPVSIPEKRRSQPQHESNPPPQTLPNRRNIPGQPPVSIPEQRSQPPKVIVRPAPENAPEASVPRMPDARDNWKQRGTRRSDEPTPQTQIIDQPRATEPGRGGALPALSWPGRASQQWGRGESGDVQRR